MPSNIGNDLGSSNNTVIIHSEEGESESPSSCKIMMGDIAFALADAIRNTLVSAALFGEWVRVMSELNREDLSPSEQAQKTWLGIVIFSLAATSGAVSSAVNFIKREHYPAAQDLVETFLSTSYLYLFLGIFKQRPITPVEFALSNLICVPPLFFLLKRFHLQDSTNQLRNPFQRSDFVVDPNPNPNHFSHALNMFSASKYMGSSLIVMVSVIMSEIKKETQPLQMWQACLIALALIPAIKIGYELYRFPGLYNLFVVTTKSLKEAGLIYKALSGFFYMIAVYNWCADRQYCLNKNAEMFLSAISLVVVAALGAFIAATTRFDFEGNRNKIKQTEKMLAAIPARLRLVGNKISDCCKKISGVDEHNSLADRRYASIA